LLIQSVRDLAHKREQFHAYFEEMLEDPLWLHQARTPYFPEIVPHKRSGEESMNRGNQSKRFETEEKLREGRTILGERSKSSEPSRQPY